MKKILSSILIINFFLLSSEIKDISIKEIASYYKEEIQIIDKKISIPKKIKQQIQNQIKQKFYRDQIYYWVIKKNGVLNYALLDNVIGKTMPITFMVIFNEDQRVIHSSIIKYREGYGGEISGKRWLAQYKGMSKDSLYQFGKEIDGITGATISVKSFSKGINKLSLLLPYIIDNHNDGN